MFLNFLLLLMLATLWFRVYHWRITANVGILYYNLILTLLFINYISNLIRSTINIIVKIKWFFFLSLLWDVLLLLDRYFDPFSQIINKEIKCLKRGHNCPALGYVNPLRHFNLLRNFYSSVLWICYSFKKKIN